jgi:tetratricopeptide (TPR) repeat protein
MAWSMLPSSRCRASSSISLLCQAVPILGALVLVSHVGGDAQALDSSAFARAMTLYSENRLQKALVLFERAAQDSPANVDYQNWLAETERRIGMVDEAAQTARRAAQLSRCNSFAYTVIGASYSPQYSSWELANYDSTWAYLRRAVDCDASDGNAWLLLWGESLRRQDSLVAQRALRAMVTTGILTPPTLEFARWLLQTAPPRAVVLTAGDLDTYPALALQVTEHLRPDVVIVNEPMLNLPWYTLRFGQEQGLPLPFPAESLAAENQRGTIPGDLKDSVLASWRRLAATHALGRPLLFALSTGEESGGIGTGQHQLTGAAWVVAPDSAEDIDTMAVRRALSVELDGSRWKGAPLSPSDRSAVRRASPIQPAVYVLLVSDRYGRALLRKGRPDAAQAALRNAETFASAAGLDSSTVAGALDALRAELDSIPQWQQHQR